MKKAFHLFLGLFFVFTSLLLFTASVLLHRLLTITAGKTPQNLSLARKAWGRSVLWLNRIKTSVRGAENVDDGRNYIFVVNHSSSADIPILSAVIPPPFNFVMDESLFHIPVIGFTARYIGDLPISRRHPEKALEDLDRVVEKLKRGRSVVFFPEGGRSHDGSLGNFRSGIGKLVIESGVPALPVAITGSYELMPRRGFALYPAPVTVRFGSPVKADPASSELEIAHQLHDRLAALLKE